VFVSKNAVKNTKKENVVRSAPAEKNKLLLLLPRLTPLDSSDPYQSFLRVVSVNT